GLLPVSSISFEGRDPGEIGELLRRIRECRLADRNKALAVIARRQGILSRIICRFLGIDRKSLRRYLRPFDQGSTAAPFSRQVDPSRDLTNASTKQAVFALLHEPPANRGINRTTWKMADFVRVLRSQGYSACPQVIRRIAKAAGYRWRKARTVLTSKDPAYTQKLTHIRSILSQLSAEEAFFSIDEFGPFAVKTTGGRSLMPPGEQRVVPQWQRSKGSLILTAALERSTNQVTHFYSRTKNTAEMIRTMDLLGRVCKPEPDSGYPGFSPVRGKPGFAEEPVNGLRDRAKAGLIRRSRSLQTRPSGSSAVGTGIVVR